MSAGGLGSRSGSGSNIATFNGHAHWQSSGLCSAVASNGRKHGKAMGLPLPSHGYLPKDREQRHCLRLQRMLTGRRIGMFMAVVISLVSLLMLVIGASFASVHFKYDKDAEASLAVIGEGRSFNSTSDASHYLIGKNTTTRAQPERSGPRRETASDMQHARPRSWDRYRLMGSVVSSDQPLPPGHPCQNFTLPPPPADKKRTGPRPCPVCYLPINKAIKQMPAVDTSESPIIKSLSYVVEPPIVSSTEGILGSSFGGYPSLEDRERSFQIQEHMTVYCGFVRGSKPGVGTGFDIDEDDLLEMDKCRGIVVASAIFGSYDQLQEPANISLESKKRVCFFMFVDEETQDYLNRTNSERKLEAYAVWRMVVVRNLPYSDARRNGKIPKLLLHRLFPNARFSLWIDGKLELVVDPYQVLERFLWRRNQSFAISQHYKRLDVFEEAEANKAAGKYDNTSIDVQVNFYRKEGLGAYNKLKSPFRSDVPEGCVIIREHTPRTNLFTCLWFNEVDRFTSRDQLSFAIVRDTLMKKTPWSLNMFLDCERRNFVVQAYHRDLLEQRKAALSTLAAHTNSTTTSNVGLPVVMTPANAFDKTLHGKETRSTGSRRGSGRHRQGAGYGHRVGLRKTGGRQDLNKKEFLVF